MKSTVLENCALCKFSRIEKRVTLETGICRRYPPQVVDDNGTTSTAWPEIFKEEWCGEFKPRKESLS